MKVTINGHEVNVKKGDRIEAREIRCDSIMETNRMVTIYRKVKDGRSKKLIEKKVVETADF